MRYGGISFFNIMNFLAEVTQKRGDRIWRVFYLILFNFSYKPIIKVKVSI